MDENILKWAIEVFNKGKTHKINQIIKLREEVVGIDKEIDKMTKELQALQAQDTGIPEPKCKSGCGRNVSQQGHICVGGKIGTALRGVWE